MRRYLLAILLGSVTTLFAQEKPTLRVVVEGVGPEAVNCGIKVAAVEAVAARVLKSQGIQVSKDARHPYLYLNVNAYRVMQDLVPVGCTTRLGVSVRSVPEPEPVTRGFKARAGSYVVLCDAGRLLSGSMREVGAAVTKAFDEDIKSCLAQLSY